MYPVVDPALNVKFDVKYCTFFKISVITFWGENTFLILVKVVKLEETVLLHVFYVYINVELLKFKSSFLLDILSFVGYIGQLKVKLELRDIIWILVFLV